MARVSNPNNYGAGLSDYGANAGMAGMGMLGMGMYGAYGYGAYGALYGMGLGDLGMAGLGSSNNGMSNPDMLGLGSSNSNGSGSSGSMGSSGPDASSANGLSTTVHSSGELLSTLKSAHGGDTILLAPGTYSGLSISNVDTVGGVTIKSQDPGQAAVLTDLNVDSSQGLNFSGLTLLTPVGDWHSFQFNVTNSSDIHFTGVDVHGTSADATQVKGGLHIGTSSNVSVQNSQFYDLGVGMAEGQNDQVTISGNYFHDIRVDGIENTGTSDITIDNNYFSNFWHVGQVGSGGDHSDAIQFWSTGRNTAAHDITISNNLIVQGAGHPMQGIFVQDSSGQLPYSHVTITGNAIVGGNPNGIQVVSANDVNISNNDVIALQGRPTTWIGLDTVAQATLSNNVAASFNLGGAASVSQSGDQTLSPVSDGGSSALNGWFNAHTSFLDQHPAAVTTALGNAGLLPGGGTLGADQIHAPDGGALIYGMAGDDRIWGGSGDDHLYGGPGNDIMVGGAGNDFMDGGPGADVMAGDYGSNTFIYQDGDFAGGVAASEDTILDFSSAKGDKIDLSRVDANTGTVGVNDPFTFIGTQAFHHTAGELRYDVGGGAAILYGDTNGDGQADFAIKLVGVTSLSASDLIL
jgi:hypothetical protein